MNETNSAADRDLETEFTDMLSKMNRKEKYYALRLILCMKAIPDGETLESWPATKELASAFMQDCREGKLHTQQQYFDYVEAIEKALQIEPPADPDAREAEPPAPAKIKHFQFDHTALCARIKEKYGTYKAFAAALHIAPSTLRRYLNNLSSMSIKTINGMVELLELSGEQVTAFFFTLEEDAKCRIDQMLADK